MNLRAIFWCSLIPLSIGFPAGCGSDNQGRVAVSGEVTLDGAPLSEGTITLIPTAKGATAAGQIADGKFEIAASQGPGVGPYLVEIHSIRPTGRTITDSDDQKTLIEETQDAIPVRYNRDTKLRIDVTAGGENRFPLALESKRESEDSPVRNRNGRRRR